MAADVAAVLGAPDHQPSGVDWMAVRGRLGLRLPDDYVRLASAYPALRINDFLNVLHPVSGVESYRLLDYGLRLTEAGATLAARYPEEYPQSYYPAPGGLLCWGWTDNGDHCYWRTDDWRIVVGDGDYWPFDGDVTDFVTEFFLGRLECPVFPPFEPADIRQILEIP
jgi:hypothetical protein